MIEYTTTINYAVIIILIFVFFMIYYYFRNLRLKNFKYRIIFLREDNNIPFAVKSILFADIKDDHFSYNERTYNIDTNKPFFLNKKKEFVFYVNIDSGHNYVSEKIKTINPETLDILLKNKIMKDLTKGLKKEEFNWIILLLGLFIGITIGFLIMYFTNNTNDTTSYQQTNPVMTLSIIKNVMQLW